MNTHAQPVMEISRVSVAAAAVNRGFIRGWACCWKLFWPIGLLLALSMESSMARAQESSLEYAIKGAYLFKFGDFVEWPEAVFAQPNAPFVIGILGEYPFGPNLDPSLHNPSPPRMP